MSSEEKPTRWQAVHLYADESADGYTALFESRDEAIAAGRKAWPGEKEIQLQGFAPGRHADMVSTWRLVEDIQERLEEECGNAGNEPSKAAIADLEERIGEWIKDHVKDEVWRFCGRPELVRL